MVITNTEAKGHKLHVILEMGVLHLIKKTSSLHKGITSFTENLLQRDLEIPKYIFITACSFSMQCLGSLNTWIKRF